MARDKSIRITVLGTRGSTPTCGVDYAEFGGNTSCYLVEAGGESILLDAGSGLANAPSEFVRTPTILLSHLHIDHMLGLGTYQRLSIPGAKTRLCVPAFDQQGAQEAIDRLYSPPLWPLRLGDYGGDLQIEAMQDVMRIGDVSVETKPGSHPGGCYLIRIRYGQKTLVYATDFEHGDEASARLVEFARGADLLLYDGQYDVMGYEAHRGFGHSTYEEGLSVMQRGNARRLLVVHHDPHSTDQELHARERAVGRADVRFAREGETIEI